MKISELIQKAQEALDAHGDLDAEIESGGMYNDRGEWGDVERVAVEEYEAHSGAPPIKRFRIH